MDRDRTDPRYPELEVEPEFDTAEQENEHLRKTVADLLRDLTDAREMQRYLLDMAERRERAQRRAEGTVTLLLLGYVLVAALAASKAYFGW